MKQLIKATLLLLISVILSNCSQQPTVPSQAQNTGQRIKTSPDYTETVIPPNIAPLNFQIKKEAEAYIVTIKGNKKTIILAGDKKGTIQIPMKEWKELLSKNKRNYIQYTVYTKENKQWKQWKQWKNFVAKEAIDPFISYRLIEPGFEAYFRLGIYQRSLEDFIEKPIYENNRTYKTEDNHCINCHSYQNGKTDKMLFHVRNNHGGTIIVNKDQVTKVNLKTDSTLSAGVYPAWHPTLDKVVFSTNKTGQAFHINSNKKIEVLDNRSDLIIYDLKTNKVKSIFQTDSIFETYPAWNPTGDTLYYCAFKAFPEIFSEKSPFRQITLRYDSVYYDLYAIAYDKKKDSFGTPIELFPASRLHKSITLPRVSPNGKYLLFTLGNYGQFHIWHPSSDLYLLDIKKKRIRPLNRANSKQAESYHTWSSNSHWIVFSSRRDDGSYTRLYFSYINDKGIESKPFILPQKDPDYNTRLMKSYNIPEFMKEAIKIDNNAFKETIYKTKAVQAEYESEK